MDISETIQTIIQVYLGGGFPMAEDGELRFFGCDPRWVYRFDAFHIPSRLRKLYRRQPFRMTADTAFDDVIAGCRAGRPEWISDELATIYSEMFRLGYAHSVEAWTDDGRLAGGLYGMQFGAAFLAESMFHTLSNASNICLISLMDRLRRGGFHFCDIQYANRHTLRFHPVALPFSEFYDMFQQAVQADATF